MIDVFNMVKNLIRGNSFYDKDVYISAKSFYDYPVLTKADVLPYYNSCNYREKGYYIFHTSGSTGTPMKITWASKDYMQSIASLWRLRKKYGITSRDFCLTCHSGFLYNGELSTEPICAYGRYLSLSKLHFTSDQIDNYIHYIRIYSPTWIYAQPSFVYQLGLCLMQRAPEVITKFTYVELVGESVDPFVKKQIQTIFSSAIVITMYGLQEFNCAMYEDDGHMKECSDNVYIEILDENNQPCEIGQIGNIVITGLKNSLLPLIRYNTEDRGKKIIIKGKEYFVITQGRSNDVFVYNNKMYDGSLFFSVITQYNLKNIQKISRFQVIQHNELLMFRVFGFDGLPLETSIKKDLEAILKSNYDIIIQIEVFVENDFSKFIQGQEKTKYFLKL